MTHAVRWRATSDGWYQNIGLLIGQLAGPGHQYYGDDLDGDALIEVSFCEPRNTALLSDLIASGQAVTRFPQPS